MLSSVWLLLLFQTGTFGMLFRMRRLQGGRDFPQTKQATVWLDWATIQFRFIGKPTRDVVPIALVLAVGFTALLLLDLSNQAPRRDETLSDLSQPFHPLKFLDFFWCGHFQSILF